MIKKKKNFVRYLYCYGVIDKIENGEIEARLYDYKHHEIIDVISFNITEFPEWQRKHVSLYVLFNFSVGEIGRKPYTNFRLIYRKKLTKKEREDQKERIEKQVEDLMTIFKN